jgi:Ca2+-transporting ATPase
MEMNMMWLRLGSLLLTLAVLEIPFLSNAFGFTPIGWTEYGIALALAFIIVPVVEVVKFIQRKLQK